MKVPSSGKASWLWPVLGPGLLVLAVLAMFGPVGRFGFAEYDEKAQLIDNELVRELTPRGIARMFSTFNIVSYYPVRLLSFAVDYRFWGLGPGGYHLTNLLLHAANTLLVYWLLGRLWAMTRPDGRGPGNPDAAARTGAALAAGLFALHPVVVEPVAWIGAREELLMLLFALACVHLYLAALGGRARRRLPCYALAVVAAACACMSNVVAAAIPLVLAALCLTAVEYGPRRAVRERFLRVARSTWPFWIISIAAIVVKKIGFEMSTPEGVPVHVDELTLAERATTVLGAYALNLKTLVWPDELIVMYPAVSDEPMLGVIVAAGAVLVAATVAALWLVRRNRLGLGGLGWFVFALAPSSQIVPHNICRADRFLYLPLVGIAIGALAGYRWLIARRVRPAWAVAAAVAVLCAAGTRSRLQLPVWRNGVTLFEHCLRIEPDTFVAHHYLSGHFLEAEQYERAIGHLKKVVEINPRRLDAHLKLGAALTTVGREAEAVGRYAAALDVHPGFRLLHNELAWLLATSADPQVRDGARAVRHARAACQESDYDEPEYLDTLAAAYAEAGRFDDAVRTAERALELARSRNMKTLAAGVRARLALFRDNRPYRSRARPAGP